MTTGNAWKAPKAMAMASEIEWKASATAERSLLCPKLWRGLRKVACYAATLA
jgi:hypothetical protein